MFTEGAGDVARCIVDKKGSRYTERESKMRQVRAALSGLVIEGATEPGHALLDAAAHF